MVKYNNRLFEQYRIQKSELTKISKYLEGLLSRKDIYNEYDNEKSLLSDISSELFKDIFVVSVVGQMCRGKSTLLNALLRKQTEICSTNICVNTAKITELNYSDDEYAKVIFKNSKSKKILINDLKEYVDKDGRYVNETLLTKVYLQNQYLRNGVRLVDTPGVDDPDKNREEVTINYLNKSDAVIFLVTPDGLISNSEKEFLIQKVFNDNSIISILVVMNKIDETEEDNLKEICEYVLENVNKILKAATGEKISQIIPVSAKNAIDGFLKNDEEIFNKSQFPDFEDKLQNFLVTQRGHAKLFRLIKIIRKKILEKIINNINNQLLLSNDSLKEIESKIIKLEATSRELKQKTENNNREADIIRREVRNDMQNYIKNDIWILNELIDQVFQNSPTESQMKELENEVKDIFSKTSIQSRKKLEETLKNNARMLFSSQEKNMQNFLSNIGSGINAPTYSSIDFERAKKYEEKETGFFRSLWNGIKEFFLGIRSTEKQIVYYKNEIQKAITNSRESLLSSIDNIIDETMKNIKNIINKDTEEMISNIRKQLNKAKTNKSLKDEENNKKMKHFNEFLSELNEIQKNITNLEFVVRGKN
ncbi:MAG: dynamin family protein [Ignavibacteria bacterium]